VPGDRDGAGHPGDGAVGQFAGGAQHRGRERGDQHWWWCGPGDVRGETGRIRGQGRSVDVGFPVMQQGHKRGQVLAQVGRGPVKAVAVALFHWPAV
jgi:hypothetical protein